MKNTEYRVEYTYGYAFGGHKYFNTLKEAWNTYKEIKNNPLTDGVGIIRVTRTKKHFWSKEEITETEILGWIHE